MEIREYHNTFLCGIPGLLQVSFQTRDFSLEGCWFGQCLSVNTIFSATDDMWSESPKHSAPTCLIIKIVLLYVLICGGGSACSWTLHWEGRWGAAGLGLGCSPLPAQPRQAGCPSGDFPFLCHRGAWRSWQGRSYLIRVKVAVRACVAAQVLPAPFSRTKESRNSKYQVFRCPWQGPLVTPQTGGDCSPTWFSKRCEQSATLFFMPCDKNLSWSPQFPCFCALLKPSRLPAMSGLGSHRLIGGKYSLALAVGWAWTAVWS